MKELHRIIPAAAILVIALAAPAEQVSDLPSDAAVLVKPQQKLANGAVWPDDQGVHINAHGGGVLFHQGRYYWFGEHKIAGRAGNKSHVGVRCYSSVDLSNWRNDGVVLAVSDDTTSDIVRECVIERPKVIYNGKTERFVMWFHLELRGQGYKAARTGVAVSESVAGPYTFLRSLRPHAGRMPEGWNRRTPVSELLTLPSEGPRRKQMIRDGYFLLRDLSGGQMARDMTLFVDDDGTGYHIHASEENQTLHIAELTDDYLSFAGRYRRIFPGGHNEAPAVFKHDGTYYMISSGCTGWAPNAARSASASSIWGPWKSLGNPCRGVNSQNNMGPEKTFGGQSTFVLPVADKPGTFIAMFDIWRPQNAIDGRYLWLPVTFTDTGFELHYQDIWSSSILE